MPSGRVLISIRDVNQPFFIPPRAGELHPYRESRFGKPTRHGNRRQTEQIENPSLLC